MHSEAFLSCRLRSIVRRLCGLGSAGILMLVPAGHAEETNVTQFALPSSWVKLQFFTPGAPASLPGPGEDEHLLLRERQINAAQHETFCHLEQQILTPSGVQNGSTLTIDFNPGYQTLTVHWARLWRGPQHFDRLDTNNVKVVQREADLDQFALNGEKSAILVLDDVRVGDIIDYAYTIKGENPVFGGHFSAGVPVQLAQPAERLLTRVVWMGPGRLYAKPLGCFARPTAVVGKDPVEYFWDFRQVPGAAFEDSLPLWCTPEPWVQLSDFKTWAEVNQWAAALFSTAAPTAAGLNQKIAEWKQLENREQQILAALRFVQDEVRYFGIEIGDSTEKPADPSQVFTRRFGDCKDKALLFVTILRALKIEAYPVLVNSTSGRAIAAWQPSAGAFDHCIAVVRLDGQTYWLDPTITYQRGSLAAHYLPDYGCGLVIAPNTAGLTAIPHAVAGSQTATLEYFQIHGKTEPAQLKVVTVAEGRDADRLREFFASTKRNDIEKSYTHFYAEAYPGIKMASPVAIVDDEARNRIQTTEMYALDKAWTQSDKDKRYRFQFYPSTIAGLLKKPVDTDRKFPLGVNFPEHQILHTEVTLPGSWTDEADKKTIFDPAFTLSKSCRRVGGKLVMDYEYQSLTDFVPPERVGQYLEQLNEGSQALGYALSWR